MAVRRSRSKFRSSRQRGARDTACGPFERPGRAGRRRRYPPSSDGERFRPSGNGFPSGLVESREPLQRFFANAPVGIAVVDRSGRFIKANRALGELFDTPPETLIGGGLIDCLIPDDRAAIAAKLADAADGRGDCTPVEIRLKPPGERTMVMLLGRFDQSEDTKATSEATSASGAAAPAVKPGSRSRGRPRRGSDTLFHRRDRAENISRPNSRNRKKCRRWASSPAGSRTISTIC